MKLSDDVYEQYKKAIDDFRENELESLRNRKTHLEGQKRYLEKKRQKDFETVQRLAKTENVADSVFEDANAAVEEDEYNIARAQDEIEEIKRKLSGSEDLALSQQEFLGLIESVGKQIENGNFVQKDAIARLLLLNVEIDDKKHLTPIWNEAFQGLFSSQAVPDGERSPNLYEPLCGAIDYIIENPNWRPTYILVQSSIINRPSDFTY